MPDPFDDVKIEEEEIYELPKIPQQTIAPVTIEGSTGRPSFILLIARLVELLLDCLCHNQFFPGNAGLIDYKLLNRKVETGRYEPPSPDVKHFRLTTEIGTFVGVHVWEALGAKEVVIFSHGNTRSPRFLNDFCETLAGNQRGDDGKWLSPANRKRVVIGQDFPGYDLSSRVPPRRVENGAMANANTAIKWVAKRYPDARIIAVGRSIGTYGWANHLGYPRVRKAIGIVPFAEPAPVVEKQLTRFLPKWDAVTRLAFNIVNTQFPHGIPSVSGNTKGFSSLEVIHALGKKALDGKEVWLFPANDDEMVPVEDAERLKAELEQHGCNVQITMLSGSHHALPENKDFRGFFL